MRIVWLIVLSSIILLSGCCTVIKMYDGEKTDAEVAEIICADGIVLFYIDEKVAPLARKCTRYAVPPGRHVVAAGLDKTEKTTVRVFRKASRELGESELTIPHVLPYIDQFREKISRYRSKKYLKVSFTAEAGHTYEVSPRLVKEENKWRVIITDTRTGREVQKIHIDLELIKKLLDEKKLRKKY